MKTALMTNFFWRNVLTTFGFRNPDNQTRSFTPYFRYRIGKYQRDYYLYFSKGPTRIQYTNEIINKLIHEYEGYEMIKYLDFHYNFYKDKLDFLRFLQSELSERLASRPSKHQAKKYRLTLDWINEQKEKFTTYSNNIPGQQPLPAQHEHIIDQLSGSFSARIEQIIEDAEIKMESLTGSFLTGNVELNNHNHLEKLIQVLILLQTVQAPPHIAKAEQLFKRFSATDLASVLLLHFEFFKNKRLKTVQVKIKESSEKINPGNIKILKLTEALQQFFY